MAKGSHLLLDTRQHNDTLCETKETPTCDAKRTAHAHLPCRYLPRSTPASFGRYNTLALRLCAVSILEQTFLLGGMKHRVNRGRSWQTPTSSLLRVSTLPIARVALKFDERGMRGYGICGIMPTLKEMEATDLRQPALLLPGALWQKLALWHLAMEDGLLYLPLQRCHTLEFRRRLQNRRHGTAAAVVHSQPLSLHFLWALAV